MLKLAEIKQIILEQRDIFLQTERIIKRDILLDPRFMDICRLREAVIITGVRRCGKSYLMKLIWKKLKKELNNGEDNFLYVNFESEKMLNFTAQDFDALLEAYRELFNSDGKQKIFLFFDEIQNILGWEKFISRLLEEDKYKIFITGSNASLLSKEIGTALTGRNFPMCLFPLSFKEFYHYRANREIKNVAWLKKEDKAGIKKIFRDFLNIGGFPEVVKNNFRPLLEEYLRNIIYRDIVLRHRIKYEASLREIVLFLASNIGAPLSLSKISQMTKVKNVMTVKNYLSHLEDSFLFYFVHQHSFSVKQQIYNPDKSYLCDIGLYQEINLSPGGNDGRILENLVFNELTRRDFSVFYFTAKKECDFILQKKNKVVGAIQVGQRLDDTNKDRELAGLLSAMEKYGLKEGLILNEDEEDELIVKGAKINIVPIYKWLLFL
ncbi:MAG: ATP-binding protein [Candidatus Magasanikbacteria bacterium]|nr:ATP-binding protein [Candidatus Magasanikbacteria bacterium]